MHIFIEINPILIKTATYETLTVNYAEASFKTVVTRDVSTLMYLNENNILHDVNMR